MNVCYGAGILKVSVGLGGKIETVSGYGDSIKKLCPYVASRVNEGYILGFRLFVRYSKRKHVHRFHGCGGRVCAQQKAMLQHARLALL